MSVSNYEILVGRMIDRSIRPLFPTGFNADTQVSCNLLTYGGQQNPDIVCINTVSYALHTSDIPWNGPIGCVRVGMSGSKFIINPTKKLLEKSPLNLVITVNPNGNILMTEGWADNLRQSQFIDAFEYGTNEAKKIVEAIKNSKYSNIPKRKLVSEAKDEELFETIKTLSELQLHYVYTNTDHDKVSRDDEVNVIRQRTLDLLKDEKYSKYFRTENEQKFYDYFTEVAKKVFRKVIIEEEKRCDGRKLDQLRPIICKINLLEGLHGSALFQRGQTQVLCSLTFDSPDSMYRTDAITNMVSPSLTKLDKKFMLHYEFPQYAVNEISRTGGRPDRREIGHGALAEKALYPFVPSDTKYTIRLLCEVLESNGSSSMASVCAGSLALVDAGVDMPELACGVAMGLVSNYDDNQNITDYKILTDLAGIEDFMGDTDFKVAGTEDAISAIQVDVKNNGLPLNICRELIEKSQAARVQILEIMKKSVEERDITKPKRLPVVKEIKIQIHERAKFLGVGGMNLKRIENSTGVIITPIDEITFNIFAPHAEAYAEAEEMIRTLLGTTKEPELQFGAVYTAKVISIVESGVMVQLHPAMKPVLLPNSQLDATKIRHGSMSGFKEGQEIQVKYFGRDPVTGAIRLSRKALFLSAFRHKNLMNDANKSELNVKNILGQFENEENVKN